MSFAGSTSSVVVETIRPTGVSGSGHLYWVTLENTSLVATDPGAQCGVTGFPACPSFALTSVNTAGVYQGTITGGANNAFVNRAFNVAGFANAGNNQLNRGCTASTATSLTLGGVTISETVAATATFTSGSYKRYMVGNNTQMPYLQTLIAKGTYATNFYSNVHSSWPAWMLMTSGMCVDATANCTQFVNCNGGNCETNEQCFDTPNLVRSVLAAGKTWKAYSEGMPYAGYQIDNTTTAGCTTSICGYKRGHNPLMNYKDACQGAQTNPNGGSAIPPASSCTASNGQFLNSVPFTQFATDSSGNLLPNFSYITPDLGHDMHGGQQFSLGLGAGTGSPKDADDFLASFIPTLLTRPEFQPGGDGVLIISVDEGNITGGGNPPSVGDDAQCAPATNTCPAGIAYAGASGGGHVLFLAVGPKIRVNSTATATYHFEDLLQTISSILGITAPGVGSRGAVMDIF